MSQTLKKFSPYLRMLLNSSASVRNKLTKKHCSPEFIKCICECAKNVLAGNVSLSSEHKRKLKRYKHSLRKLALKRTPMKIKRKIIQSGGFLGAILGPIVKVLGGLFGAT